MKKAMIVAAAAAMLSMAACSSGGAGTTTSSLDDLSVPDVAIEAPVEDADSATSALNTEDD